MKSAAYANNLLALNHAHQRDFDDVLFLNEQKRVCETSTSNIFAVINGNIHYPPDDSGCLPGVTRSLIIELAQKNGIHVTAAPLMEDDLTASHELFITSAIRGVVGVSRYESTEYPQHTITDKMRKFWQEAITADTAKTKA